jgi:hypothetical protein
MSSTTPNKIHPIPNHLQKFPLKLTLVSVIKKKIKMPINGVTRMILKMYIFHTLTLPVRSIFVMNRNVMSVAFKNRIVSTPYCELKTTVEKKPSENCHKKCVKFQTIISQVTHANLALTLRMKSSGLMSGSTIDRMKR